MRTLAAQVEADGGHVLAAYREPVGGHWQLFCLLPIDAVAPTPYQRDLSPTHAKRLTEVVKKIGRFVDPIVVVSPRAGVYWTPNGHHRRTALEKLKAELVPAILVPELEVAYQILALNTEKAHNLKEKSLEVDPHVPRARRGGAAHERGGLVLPVRSAALRDARPRLRGEQALRGRRLRADPQARRQVPEGEAAGGPRGARGAGGDGARRRRGARAAVAALKKRGINHPYVKNYVLARTSPLTRARKTLPSFDQAFARLVAAIEGFDASKVRYEDVQRASMFAAPAAE